MQNMKYVSVKSRFKQKGCQVISEFLLTDSFNPIRVIIVDILATHTHYVSNEPKKKYQSR